MKLRFAVCMAMGAARLIELAYSRSNIAGAGESREGKLSRRYPLMVALHRQSDGIVHRRNDGQESGFGALSDSVNVRQTKNSRVGTVAVALTPRGPMSYPSTHQKSSTHPTGAIPT